MKQTKEYIKEFKEATGLDFVDNTHINDATSNIYDEVNRIFISLPNCDYKEDKPLIEGVDINTFCLHYLNENGSELLEFCSVEIEDIINFIKVTKPRMYRAEMYNADNLVKAYESMSYKSLDSWKKEALSILNPKQHHVKWFVDGEKQ